MRAVLLWALLLGAIVSAQAIEPPPGVVVNHMPSNLQRFVGSPSICILPDGSYVASHDEFGPTSSEFKSAVTRIYMSKDRGRSWKRISQINGQFWSVLFCVKEHLYTLGTNKHHGNLILRRSDDGGVSWTNPYDGRNGLLLEGEYHTAPTPVLIHGGRIWKGVEYATAPTLKWGERYSAMVMSAPVGCDLLDARNWRRSNHLYHNPAWLDAKFGAWLEGNMVADRSGRVVNLLRVHVPQGHREVVAVVRVNRKGTKVEFDSEEFYPMPGAAKKFTIRYDAVSDCYWSLVNEVPDSLSGQSPDKVRNVLTLVCSPDLKRWERHTIVVSHPDRLRHGVQYVDWQFDGEDIVLVARTAWDDDLGGAANSHDANFLTFMRIPGFRSAGQ